MPSWVLQRCRGSKERVRHFYQTLAQKEFFIQGGEIVNGREKWENNPSDSALLNWWPVYADVAISGDFGYTTGPWQFFKSRTDKEPVANGFYSTIWRKEADGKWRVLTDLGIGTRDQYTSSTEVNSPKIKGEKANVENVKNELQSLETKYLSLLNASSVSYQVDYLAGEFRVHRPQNSPCTSKEKLPSLNEQQNKFSFEYAGMDISSSGDLAFTYGKVKVEVNLDNTLRTIPANYIRVWKRIGGTWKIVLDVIGVG